MWQYMLNALTDAGRADVAYAMASKKDYPGWGYMLENGATTLWETWKKEEFIYSHNHPMFGSVSEWFFKALGGIQPAPDAVGFDKIVIKPNVVGGLQWVKSRYESVRGPVVSEWQVQEGNLAVRVQVPANAEALLYLPTGDGASVTEGGRYVSTVNVPGVTLVSHGGGTTVYRVGSGEYRFHIRRGPDPDRRGDHRGVR
jgi:alpha-L-rhamnosidase